MAEQSNADRIADLENHWVVGAIHIMRGLPGSGKSTFVQNKIKSGEWDKDSTIVCSADDYMVNAQGDYEFKPVRLKNAHIKCRLKFIKAIYYTTNEPTHIVVDNTNIELEDFAEYILLAKSTSRLLWIHEMAPVDVKERDPKTKKNRLLSNRELSIRTATAASPEDATKTSNHGVTEQQIKIMRHKFQPMRPEYIDDLIKCDELDPFHSFQSEAVKSFRFDVDEKAVGINNRVQALMHNPNAIEHAEKEFDYLLKHGKKDMKLMPIMQVISKYKDVHECAHSWKELAQLQLENGLTNPEDVALHAKLTLIYKYLFIQMNKE